MIIPKWTLLVISALVIISFSPAYAQHHSGALAPPVDFDGLQVALSTILSPDDFIIEDQENANLSVRFFDSETNTNIQSVTYRIQIFHEDALVANEYFYDEDGNLDVKIKPTSGCQEKDLWKCTEYYGEKHAIAGAYYARGDSLPTIQGPVFDKSGQYNVKVSIVGATNPKTMTTSDLLFETFLHIPQKETFQIKTANAEEFPISIKSYNGDISNFVYDESSKKISFEIPYQKEKSTNHHESNRQIISIEEEFSDFKQGYDVNVFVDGIPVNNQPFGVENSITGKNIITIDIPHDEIISIKEKMKTETDSTMLEIVAGEKTKFDHMDFVFEDGIKSKIEWNAKASPGNEIPFTFYFLDANGMQIDNILFAYSINDNSGAEIWSNIGATETYLGILAPNGVARESILIPSGDQYNLKLIITGQDSKNFENFLISDSSFTIAPSSNIPEVKETTSIPTWIKNNAGWWADGTLDDSSFFQGIEFLIEEGFMEVSITEQESESQSDEIPIWVKSNAGWWAEDLISEDDFVRGIEFLISNGIIAIN